MKPVGDVRANFGVNQKGRDACVVSGLAEIPTRELRIRVRSLQSG
jgi:hypothetical protein